MGASKAIGSIVKRGILDFAVALALFLAVAGFLQSTEGHAVTSQVPLELVAKSDALRLLGVSGTAEAAKSGAAVQQADAYAIASQTPWFGTDLRDHGLMLGVLSLAFAAIAAFNLALVRHVLRVAFVDTRLFGSNWR